MSKEYLEALDWLEEKCYVESPQAEKFEECCKIIRQFLHRLESIDNAEPSEALECLERIGAEKLARGELIRNDDKVEPYLDTIKQALLRLGKYERILGNGRLTDRNYKNTTLDLDSCKPYLRLGQLEDIYEEGK